MSRELHDELRARYAAALRDYFGAVDAEGALADAYALGREAVDTGLGVLDLTAIHEHALTPILLSAQSLEDSARASERAYAFFCESLAPFEMVHRGFREANTSLKDANAALERYAAQLSEAKAALERERSTLSGLSGMSDGVVLIDGAQTIRYCNARAGELLGVTAESLIGQRAAALASLVGGQRTDLESWLAEQDRPGSIEIAEVGPPPRDLLIQTFPVAESRARGGVGLVLRDVTAERELARAKDELVAIVSHELRTPLTSILGFAALLVQRQFDSETRRRHLETIYAEATRLTELTNHFLDLQRLERRDLGIAPERVDVSVLITRAAEALGQDFAPRLVVDIPASLPEASADLERVLQVLVNLLSNARKYSPAGSEVRVSARDLDDRVELCVADEGLGLPASALPHVFEKFYRVDSPDRSAIRGTGLGLAICREIVEAHGGTIWAESEGPGRGSRFCFTLPTGDGVTAGASPAPGAAIAASKPNPEGTLTEL